MTTWLDDDLERATREPEAIQYSAYALAGRDRSSEVGAAHGRNDGDRDVLFIVLSS